MARFNIEKAKAAGYSDQDIQQYLSQNPSGPSASTGNGFNLTPQMVAASYSIDPKAGDIFSKMYNIQAQANQPSPIELQKQKNDLAVLEAQQKKQQEQNAAKDVIGRTAQDVLDLIQNKGKFSSPQEYRDALKYAVSDYNKRAFEEAGKTVTGGEKGLIAGTQIKTSVPRKANFIENIFGMQPSDQGGDVLDPEQVLLNKMNMALRASRGETINDYLAKQGSQQQPETAPVDQQSQQNGFNIPTTNYPQGPKSLQGFLSNAGQDISETISGIGALPGVLGDIIGGRTSGLDVAKQAGKGIVQGYADLATQPVERGYNKPVSTALDVASLIFPFLKAGKAGEAASALGKAGEAAKGLETTADIGKILNKAARVGEEGSNVGKISKDLYLSTLGVSKKASAFEKLKPAETAADMIKYGIKGNPDEILNATKTVTGQNGILSNIYRDAITAKPQTIPLNEVMNNFENATSRFAALGNDKVKDLAARVRQSVPQQGIGQINQADAFDLAKQLEGEAVQHRIAFNRSGDTAAKELADLKSGIADTIENQIDKNIGTEGLNQYKDPRIIQALDQVSPQLAKDFQSAKNMSDVRRLQKSFVRMSKMLELSANEPASLGSKMFGSVAGIPLLGPLLSAGVGNVANPLLTNLAVGLENPLIKNITGGSSQLLKKAAQQPATYRAATESQYGF